MAEQEMATSTVTLRIDIRHDLADGNLPDAQTIGMWVAQDLARSLRLSIPESTDPERTQRFPAAAWGRFNRFGAEDGQHVATFIQSAAITARKEA